MHELREIQDRRRGDSDVKALLYEIFRMQAILLRVDQLSRSAMPWSGTMGQIWQEVLNDLQNEPTCIKQRQRTNPYDW